MKMTVRQFTAPLFIAILIVCNSFTIRQNSIANGGGIAGGDIHFNFNAVEQKDGSIVGHLQYGDNSYSVVCAEWFDNQAILYTDGGVAFLVSDNGEGTSADPDTISGPVAGECGDLELADFLTADDVTSGNIQVKE